MIALHFHVMNHKMMFPDQSQDPSPFSLSTPPYSHHITQRAGFFSYFIPFFLFLVNYYQLTTFPPFSKSNLPNPTPKQPTLCITAPKLSGIGQKSKHCMWVGSTGASLKSTDSPPEWTPLRDLFTVPPWKRLWHQTSVPLPIFSASNDT